VSAIQSGHYPTPTGPGRAASPDAYCAPSPLAGRTTSSSARRPAERPPPSPTPWSKPPSSTGSIPKPGSPTPWRASRTTRSRRSTSCSHGAGPG